MRFSDHDATLILKPEFADAKLHMEQASHLIVLYWLNRSDRSTLRHPTSFDGVTEDDREAFREDPQKVSLVARFIETKSGAVRFTKNEWNAAEKLGERYFAYRVSFLPGRRDKAVLTIVKNPRAQSSAIRVEHELLIDQVSSREEYDLFQTDKGDIENLSEIGQ